MKVKGNGSIQQVKDKHGVPVKNSWQLVLSLGNDPLTGKRRRELRPFRGNRTEAKRALNEFRREVEHGLKIDADKITFGQYAMRWQKSREASGQLAPSTARRYSYTIHHLMQYLDMVKLGDIDASTIRNVYLALADDGVGQNSIAKAHVMLKQILRQAVNDDIILSNYCDRVEAPKPPRQEEVKVLDKAGVLRLTQALDDIESTTYPLAHEGQQRLTSDLSHTTAVRLALATGLRRGEILALSWSGIDFSKATLSVRHTLCNTTSMLKPPKTHKSIRTISLDPAILAHLARLRDKQAQYLQSVGIMQDADTPVICTETGGRMDGNNLDRWWRRFRKHYGFDLKFHGLRHTHATILLSSDVKEKTISERLGHTSVRFTLDRYAHVLREDDEKAAVIMGKAMTQPAPRMLKVVNL